jgi:hypothetical protein
MISTPYSTWEEDPHAAQLTNGASAVSVHPCSAQNPVDLRFKRLRSGTRSMFVYIIISLLTCSNPDLVSIVAPPWRTIAPSGLHCEGNGSGGGGRSQKCRNSRGRWRNWFGPRILREQYLIHDTLWQSKIAMDMGHFVDSLLGKTTMCKRQISYKVACP